MALTTKKNYSQYNTINYIIPCRNNTAASASHTFKKGKYKLTVSDKQYKKLKKHDQYHVSKKVGTVKKTKWVTKKVKTYETWLDSSGYMYKSKSWNPYKKVGYKAKYIKSVTKYYSDGEITWEYYKVPKKKIKKINYIWQQYMILVMETIRYM